MRRAVFGSGMGCTIGWVLIVFYLGIFSAVRVHSEVTCTDLPISDLIEQLRDKVETASETRRFSCSGEMICGISAIPAFYGARGYRPAWCGEDGLFFAADELIAAIGDAGSEGLSPEHYHLNRIETLLDKIRRERAMSRPVELEPMVDLELLLSDAFLLYGSHLLAGRVNPETIHSSWHPHERSGDLSSTLRSALDSGRVSSALSDLKPPHSGYRSLRRALSRYHQLAESGGWPAVPAGPSLRIGDRNMRVPLLRQRLIRSGDLDGDVAADQLLFDDALETAVVGFQWRHGLDPDGIVGRKTLAALNVSVATRLRQIELNLERWRWIPHDLGTRHVLVNIAAFHLDVVENGTTVLDMRVVAGRRYRKTPVFSREMKYLEFNPYWNIPPSLAIKDVLPHILADPDYLARKRIRVFQGWGEGAEELDPLSIDWTRVGRRYFPYKLRQDPGPGNSLGRVKFMLPNRFSVYLHDTPKQSLFTKHSRGFSSGCIRVEKPVNLAEYLLTSHPQWDRHRILQTIDAGKRTVVVLNEPVPVHILYWTAWVDENGTVNFRDDIYRRDPPLDQALLERPPR